MRDPRTNFDAPQRPWRRRHRQLADLQARLDEEIAARHTLEMKADRTLARMRDVLAAHDEMAP